MSTTTFSSIQRELIVAFPRQQWLRERATMLRYAYTTCLALVENKTRQAMYYNVTLRRVHVTIVAVEKQ